MDRFDNPLMQGPKRVDRNTRLSPASVVAEERPAYRRAVRTKPESADLPTKRSRNWHPNCDCPEPDSPEFKSELHGLNAPPRTRTILIEAPLTVSK